MQRKGATSPRCVPRFTLLTGPPPAPFVIQLRDGAGRALLGLRVGCADGPEALLRPAANDRMALKAWPGTCEDAYKDLRTGTPEGQDVQDVGRRKSWIHSRTGAGVGRPEVTPVVGRSHPDSHPDSRPGSRAHRQAPAAMISPMRRTSIRRGSARAECIRRRNPMRRRTATHARFGSWSQLSSGHIPVPASRR